MLSGIDTLNFEEEMEENADFKWEYFIKDDQPRQNLVKSLSKNSFNIAKVMKKKQDSSKEGQNYQSRQ